MLFKPVGYKMIRLVLQILPQETYLKLKDMEVERKKDLNQDSWWAVIGRRRSLFLEVSALLSRAQLSTRDRLGGHAVCLFICLAVSGAACSAPSSPLRLSG